MFKSKRLERESRYFLNLVRKSVDLSDDTQINTYVYDLARKLASNSNMDSDPLSYHVAVDSAINAFAGPGATFFINTGIIEAAGNEGQLASVIAHELAHHKQDHLLRLSEDHQATFLPSVLLILAGIAAGGDEGIAVAAGAQAARVESIIDHTLSYEREADAVGLQILTASGYSPLDARDFMLVMEKEIREQGAIQSNIHNTHPITPERIASFEARVKKYKNIPEPQMSEDFHFVRNRVKVLFEWEPNKTYRYFESRLTAGSEIEQVAAQYGYALSLAKDGQVEAARNILSSLRSRLPNNVWLLKAEAEIMLDSHEFESARLLLEETALGPEPDSAVVELYTRALLRSDDSHGANRYIRKHIQRFPDNLQLYKLQAEVAQKAGELLTGYLARAEYLFRLGSLSEAMSTLKTAQTTADDFYSREVIKEKINIIGKEISWREK
ncbi:MAG: M48 family metalloprotease [Acidiferrobacterales bacterium]|nr:M48 family metalloprotease [Acidiferrobacterales bacterium]